MATVVSIRATVTPPITPALRPNWAVLFIVIRATGPMDIEMAIPMMIPWVKCKKDINIRDIVYYKTMRLSIKKVTLLLVILAIFSGFSVPALAVAKPSPKQTSTKTKAVIKKKTTTKKVVKKKAKKKVVKKRKEKLVLNPPLIDPMNPPGGR